jgi:hypothetical protein
VRARDRAETACSRFASWATNDGEDVAAIRGAADNAAAAAKLDDKWRLLSRAVNVLERQPRAEEEVSEDAYDVAVALCDAWVLEEPR